MKRPHNSEFDRKTFKTPQSRSKKIALKKNSGFTLIELLVVISIIALLSTIVLGAMQDARTKARNSAKNSLVLEYVKALELYRGDNEKYPSAEIGQEITPKCIGYSTSENCHGSLSSSTNINDAFKLYLPSNFSHTDTLIMNISSIDREMRGVTYKCTDVTCGSYTLTWYLKDASSECLDKATSALFPDGSTGPHKICTYTLK